MMVIKRTRATPHIRDSVGARQDVLIWDYGVITGHVVAVQVLPFGMADLVVEFDVPQPVDVPDDICARMEVCRLDPSCPFADSCAQHECSDECDWCQGA